MENSSQPVPESPSAALSMLADAWAAGDADRYAALFTEDADYVAFDGTRARGRQAIAEGHRPLFAGIMRGSSMVHRDVVLRDLAPDVSLVCATGGIVVRTQGPGATPSKRRLSSVTYVLVRSAGRWQFAHFQNTRYHPWDRTFTGRVMTSLSRRSSG